MTASLVTSNTFTFADGGAGHSVNLGSSPSVGVLDVLCVNSNTTVTTPGGFTASPTNVNGQGAYIYSRIAVGGESSTVTITTTGDHDTSVIWSRWGNIGAVDAALATAVDFTGGGTTTPAHTTATLTATNELVIAFGALHDFVGSAPTTPVWSSGYTALANTAQGAAGTGISGMVGYRTDAGTAAETPSVSFTNGAKDRYMLSLTFTSTSASTNAPAESTTVTVVANAATASVSPAATNAAVTVTAGDPSASISPAASNAAVTVTAPDPGPSVGSSAESVSVVAAAFDATIAVSAAPTVAAVLATALAPDFAAVISVGAGPPIVSSSATGRITSSNQGGRL